MSDDRPLLWDVYSGAGGAARGYHLAGFRVVGIDNRPQPHYPYEFIQADALEFLADRGHVAAAVHASPPCQDHSKMLNATQNLHGTGWLLGETRKLLQQAGVPWVIENVPGAPMRPDFRLCGCQFGLPGLRRERWFETSWHGFDLRSPCHHEGTTITVAGHGMQGREYREGVHYTQADRERAMGIDWMNRDELAQAIPPAFTQYIGEQLMAQSQDVAA